MLRKRIYIAIGVGSALIVCIVVAMSDFGAWGLPDGADAGGRLALAARWLLIPALCLLAGVGGTANRRFLNAQVIDGGGAAAGSPFDINLRYNLNTLEQTVLAAIAWMGLALALPAEELSLIPRLAILFGIGRVAFWFGYLYAPWARAFGFGLTAYPTFASLAWLAWTAVT